YRKFAHELRAGEGYEPSSFLITAEVNQQFLFSIEDYCADYLCRPNGADPIVHPMLLLHMSARTRSRSFKLAPNTGSIFAKDKVIFRRPALVDEPLSTTWTIRDVYEKNGRLYQHLDIQVCGEDDVVIDREMHSVFFTKGGGVRMTAPEVNS